MPSEVFIRRRSSLLPFSLLTRRSGVTKMLVDNPTVCPLPLFQGECLGLVQPVDIFCIFGAPAAPTSTALSALTCDPVVDHSLLDAFHHSIDDETSSSEWSQLTTLLQKFRASFVSHASGLGHTSTVLYQIHTGSHAPLRQRPYRVSAMERCVVDDQVAEVLKRGVVKPSNSPWASLVVLVKKKKKEWLYSVLRRLPTSEQDNAQRRLPVTAYRRRPWLFAGSGVLFFVGFTFRILASPYGSIWST